MSDLPWFESLYPGPEFIQRDLHCVYAARPERADVVQISSVQNLADRIRPLRKNCWREIDVEAIVWLKGRANAEALEKALHEALTAKECHVRGIWYRIAPAALQTVLVETVDRLGLETLSHEAMFDLCMS